jgi:hypothetical protein
MNSTTHARPQVNDAIEARFRISLVRSLRAAENIERRREPITQADLQKLFGWHQRRGRDSKSTIVAVVAEAAPSCADAPILPPASGGSPQSRSCRRADDCARDECRELDDRLGSFKVTHTSNGFLLSFGDASPVELDSRLLMVSSC